MDWRVILRSTMIGTAVQRRFTMSDGHVPTFTMLAKPVKHPVCSYWLLHVIVGLRN